METLELLKKTFTKRKKDKNGHLITTKQTESNPLKKILEDVYKAKGKKLYKKIKWQIKFWTDEEFYKDEIVVVAAGTSAGKSKGLVTRLEIELILKKLGVRYRNQNKKLKSLICPSSTNVLLDNMVDTFIEFEPSFRYKVVSNRIELEEAILSDCDVIIALPQLCIANVDLLPKIDIFMLDEAHQWYFANNGKGSVDTIIKKIEPNQQILLTGSPSKFIAQKDKHNYKFLFVTVFDLMDEGLVHAPKVEIVSCSHKFKREDYKGNYGNLKSGKTSDKSKNKNSLREVLEEMMVKLYYNNDNKWLKNRKSLGKFTEIIHKINQMINEMGKSIIYCDSIPQANTFYKELCEMGLENQTLISHSKVDFKSDNFNEFKKNSSIKILISVDRGKLGFNESELFNVIDFTFTQSLDMLLQMLGRLLRISDKNPNKRKIYYKVATVETAEYYSNLMLGVFHLFHIDWYSKYNGKNMGQIQIPVVNKKGKNKSLGGKSKKSNKFKPLVNIDDLDLLDINVYKNVLHSNDGKFETIKWTTLDYIRREFFEIGDPLIFRENIIKDKEIYINLFRNEKIPTTNDWSKLLYKQYSERDNVNYHSQPWLLSNQTQKEFFEECFPSSVIISNKEIYFNLFKKENITSSEEWCKQYKKLSERDDVRYASNPWTTIFKQKEKEFFDECYPERLITIVSDKNTYFNLCKKENIKSTKDWWKKYIELSKRDGVKYLKNPWNHSSIKLTTKQFFDECYPQRVICKDKETYFNLVSTENITSREEWMDKYKNLSKRDGIRYSATPWYDVVNYEICPIQSFFQECFKGRPLIRTDLQTHIKLCKKENIITRTQWESLYETLSDRDNIDYYATPWVTFKITSDELFSK